MQRAGRMVLRGGAHRCIGALATPRRYIEVAQVRGEIGSPRVKRRSWVGFGRCRAAPRVHRLRLPCCRHQPCQSRALHRRRCSFCTNHSTLPCQMRPMRITTVNVRSSRGRGPGCAGGGGTAAADATAARPGSGALERAGAGRRATFEAAVRPLDPADPRFERAPGHGRTGRRPLPPATHDRLSWPRLAGRTGSRAVQPVGRGRPDHPPAAQHGRKYPRFWGPFQFDSAAARPSLTEAGSRPPLTSDRSMGRATGFTCRTCAHTCYYCCSSATSSLSSAVGQ